VLGAAAQLGYVPNSAARALRSQSTRLVGAIIPTLDHAIYAKMVDSIEETLSDAGMSLLINTSQYDLERERSQAGILVSRGVEAVILVGTLHKPETMQLLKDAGIRQIHTYTTDVNGADAVVGFDNFAAGLTVVDFLAGLQHRHIAMIAGISRGNDRAARRRDGFLAGLERMGMDPRAALIIEAPYKIENGYHAMRSIMETRPRPTAVFCGSDILAVGASKYCAEQRIGIPDAVSLVGFDDLEIATLVEPALTTLHVPAKRMGELAAKIISDPQVAARNGVVNELPLRLVVRRSTGPAHET
jgi:LacI family transcriptional regulator